MFFNITPKFSKFDAGKTYVDLTIEAGETKDETTDYFTGLFFVFQFGPWGHSPLEGGNGLIDQGTYMPIEIVGSEYMKDESTKSGPSFFLKSLYISGVKKSNDANDLVTRVFRLSFEDVVNNKRIPVTSATSELYDKLNEQLSSYMFEVDDTRVTSMRMRLAGDEVKTINVTAVLQDNISFPPISNMVVQELNVTTEGSVDSSGFVGNELDFSSTPNPIAGEVVTAESAVNQEAVAAIDPTSDKAVMTDTPAETDASPAAETTTPDAGATRNASGSTSTAATQTRRASSSTPPPGTKLPREF